MNKTLILVVEDDRPIRNLIVTTLKTHDYKYLAAENGSSAILEASSHNPDIVLLDLGLPDMEGVEVIKKIRTWSNMPIIVISARSEDTDKIEALDAGADDYLTKPFQSAVLIARIEAHLRRHHKHFLDEIKFEDVMMNTKNREVTIDDHVIVLTKVEYDLLKMFMEHPKEAVSRETLLQSIWGFQYDGDTRIVDVHVFKLKGKLKESRVSFKSVRGVGYKLVKKDD